jgi:hypothetical protein
MSVGTIEGKNIDVTPHPGCVVVGGTLIVPLSDVQEISDLLYVASLAENGEVQRTELVGSVEKVHVVRFPIHVAIRQGPDWRRHSGFTMHPHDAAALSEEITAAASITAPARA